MKYSNITVIGMLALTGAAMNASAGGCFDAGYEAAMLAAEIDTALEGKRVLATEGTNPDSPWHEDHCAGGALYKVGSTTDPTDPRAFRGTWTSVAMAPGITQGASGCAPGQGEVEHTTGPPVCLTPVGQALDGVTYHYTVGGNSSFTWLLWRRAADGGLCWEDGSGGIVATAPEPTVPAGSPCTIP